MLHTGIIWKKCWLVIVLFEFGNCELDPYETQTITKQDCKERTIEGLKCMDCSSKFSKNQQMKVHSVPVDLGTTLRCLYMYNLLWDGKIDKAMFKAYPDLTDLHMIRNGLGFDVSTDIFELLTNLQYLNLSLTNIVEETVFKLPRSIRILDLTALKISSLPIENLHLLERLYVSRTNLLDFPALYDLAPLKLVELHNVNLSNFKIDEFAKYCNLQSISTLGMSLGNDNCKCLQLMEWVKRYNIEVIHPPKCIPDSKCSLEFSESSIKNREDCLAKSSHTTLWFIIAGSVLLLLVVLGLATYLHQKLIRQEEEEGIEFVDGHVEVHKPVKEDVGEEEATPDDETGNEETAPIG